MVRKTLCSSTVHLHPGRRLAHVRIHAEPRPIDVLTIYQYFPSLAADLEHTGHSARWHLAISNLQSQHEQTGSESEATRAVHGPLDSHQGAPMSPNEHSEDASLETSCERRHHSLEIGLR